MNGIERATRFALSAVLGLAAMLTNEICQNIWFDINIYDRVDRVQNYGEFVAIMWLFIALAVAVFIWSLEGIFARFAHKEQEEDNQWLEEQLEADKLKNRFDPAFDDTW